MRACVELEKNIKYPRDILTSSSPSPSSLGLSPQGMEDTHMVLPMDLLQRDLHAGACVKVLETYGVVSVPSKNL